MNLSQALRLPKTPRLALVGAGGKTTALFQLARQLPPRVIVTATAHLHIDQVKLADSLWIAEKPDDLVGLEDNLRGVMLVTGPIQGDRTGGLNEPMISWLREVCGRHDLPLLIEADGSRQHPLKAPADYEPPIPEFVDTVVVVAGLSGLGKPLGEEFVHRPEIFADLSGLTPGEIVSPESLARVLTHPAGGLKNIPIQARRVALLNQADTPELLSSGGKMAHTLLAAFDTVLVGSLEKDAIQTFERTAGIILAAGGSKRFGSPKQLLDYHGKPFVRQVAETALAAGLSPVILISGAHATAVEEAIQDLPITITHNPDWQSGQSSSIRVGLQALPPPYQRDTSPKSFGYGGGRAGVGAAIFLLADQPQVTSMVIRGLMDQHNLELAPIIAPLVQDRRANPVLFDRVTFPALLALTGDVGGRAIFSKFPVTYLPWHDKGLLVDVDTPEDYRKMDAGDHA